MGGGSFFTGEQLKKRMIHCLFFIQEGKISICKFHHGELSLLRKEGQTSFKLEEEFWQWWEEKEEYMLGDGLDFAFVCDREYEAFCGHEFFRQNCENSIWNDKNLLNEALELLGKSNTLKITQTNEESYAKTKSETKTKQSETKAYQYLREQRLREYKERRNAKE